MEKDKFFGGLAVAPVVSGNRQKRHLLTPQPSSRQASFVTAPPSPALTMPSSLVMTSPSADREKRAVGSSRSSNAVSIKQEFPAPPIKPRMARRLSSSPPSESPVRSPQKRILVRFLDQMSFYDVWDKFESIRWQHVVVGGFTLADAWGIYFDRSTFPKSSFHRIREGLWGVPETLVNKWLDGPRERTWADWKLMLSNADIKLVDWKLRWYENHKEVEEQEADEAEWHGYNLAELNALNDAIGNRSESPEPNSSTKRTVLLPHRCIVKPAASEAASSDGDTDTSLTRLVRGRRHSSPVVSRTVAHQKEKGKATKRKHEELLSNSDTNTVEKAIKHPRVSSLPFPTTLKGKGRAFRQPALSSASIIELSDSSSPSPAARDLPSMNASLSTSNVQYRLIYKGGCKIMDLTTPVPLPPLAAGYDNPSVMDELAGDSD